LEAIKETEQLRYLQVLKLFQIEMDIQQKECEEVEGI